MYAKLVNGTYGFSTSVPAHIRAVAAAVEAEVMVVTTTTNTPDKRVIISVKSCTVSG